ncbi:MAG: sulfite exporter TauE/SafE family protein [Planctomycetota bacterium]
MTPFSLALAVGLVALLYASVGHAGATGYIAVMTLAGLEPATIRPTALLLNVLVAGIATIQFWRAGHCSWNLLLPLAATSVPCAALGGSLDLSAVVFSRLIGATLLLSAARLALEAGGALESRGAGTSPRAPGTLWGGALPVLGAAIGLLSGLTGVGGGVFLTPLLLAIDAAPIKTVAAVTAPFILVNSLAGLAGGVAAGKSLAWPSPVVLLAAAGGGLAGASCGAYLLPAKSLRILMACVLTLAGLKLLSGR